MDQEEICSKCGTQLLGRSSDGLCAVCLFGAMVATSEDTSKLVVDGPGSVIGRYKLLDKIGEGGFGSVFVAEQTEPVHRRVALKILKLGMDTQSVVTRFEVERQALALMDHPNIARVLDAGATETGRPYFVMELVAGQKLSDYCKYHGLSLQQRLELFVPVCSAVQHAHQKGIIHRDLKPSNILVTEHEGVAVPKVIDFGIAKATEQGLEQGELTSLNLFLGTPAYMSPEQVDFGRRDLDTRTDIYSLGVILYELLTGQPPFNPRQLAGAGLDEMRRIIREVDPPRPSTTITRNLTPGSLQQPVREQLGALRGDLDWIVMKCLEKDRSRRYATANGLASDIRRHLDNEPVVARPTSQFYRFKKLARRHRLVFGTAGAITIVLVAAVIVSTQLALRARRAEREQGRLRNLAQTEAIESRQHLIRRYVAEGNRLSELGRSTEAIPWMVEALQLEAGDPQREADERLRIAQAQVGNPELLLNAAQGKWVHCLALSLDGHRLATGSDDGLVRISNMLSGGEASTNVTLPSEVSTVQFNAEGTRLVAVDKFGRARVWNAATGEALTGLLQADDFDASSVAGVAKPMRPAAGFSPDGKLLLLAWGSKSAQLRDSTSGTLLRQFTHREVIYHAAFSPNGEQVVTASKDGTAQVWDTATGQPAGPPLEHSSTVTWAQFSSDGNKILTLRDRHFVQLWDWREGRPLAPEIPRRSVLFHASLSPDGSKVLTVARSGYALLYESATSRRITQFEHPGGLLDAAFSPDGRHIAIACHDGNVWVWDLEDDLRHPLILPQGNQIEQIVFNNDGRLLAVASRGGHARVWDLAPPQRGVKRLPGNDVQFLQFDPSGRRALLVNTGRQPSINLYDIETGMLNWNARLGSGEATCARFSPDGRRILAFGNGRTVVVLDSDLGRELYPPLEHEDRLLDGLWSPDGKLILTAARAGGVRAWNAVTGSVAISFPASTRVTAIAINSDGTRLAVGHADKTVQIWQTLTGEQLRTLSARHGVSKVAFTPDGKWLGISSYARDEEGIVEVFEVNSGTVVGRPLVHRDEVESFEFSPDGRWLATACDDHTARVWDVRTAQPVSPWLPHDYETLQACFSSDGTRLVTLARRGAVRLWSARTGEPVTIPLLYPRNTGDGWATCSPDGQRLLLCRGGNEAWLRELKPEPASLKELKALAEVISCTQFDPAAGMVPLDEVGLNRAWNQLHALRMARKAADPQ